MRLILSNTAEVSDAKASISCCIAEISSFLGEPEPYEIERKFLIEYPDVKALEGKYAAFGRINDGMEIIESIIKDIKADADGKIPVADQIVIESISTHASHSH